MTRRTGSSSRRTTKPPSPAAATPSSRSTPRAWPPAAPSKRSPPTPTACGSRIEKKRRGPPLKKAAKTTASAVDPKEIPGARKAKLPGAVEPQLATLVDEPPQGDEWIHELKLDGYRVLCAVRDGKTKIWTRNGKDWTDRFSPIAEAVAALPVKEALLDGEVVVLEPDGRTSFQALQNALTVNRDRDLVYFAFDLLYLDGYDLRPAQLLDRKEALSRLLAASSSAAVRISDHVQGQGEGFYRQACNLALEGVIAKRSDRPYHSGRNKDWLKIKCPKRQEFEDKPAADVVREEPQEPPREAKTVKKVSKDAAKATEFSGVKLTSPERVLYPEQGLTKRDLMIYYERIAEWMLPHVKDRPLTLVRCPEGRQKQCFYQKHVTEQFPKTVLRVQVDEEDKTVPYGAVNSIEGLLSLVQNSALEIHIWGSRRDNVEKPDYVVFDLDPDEGLAWERVVEGAKLMRRLLEELGLQSFLKTTGGKGLHVCLPLVRRAGWDEVKAFTKAVSEAMVTLDPARYTAKLPKASRKGKIYIDYLRNGRGATSICAYSTRARANAPVSTPLFWEELDTDVRADTYTVQNLPERLENLDADPWERFYQVRQSITAAMKKAVGMK